MPLPDSRTGVILWGRSCRGAATRGGPGVATPLLVAVCHEKSACVLIEYGANQGEHSLVDEFRDVGSV
jgi:hypothetical protein